MLMIQPMPNVIHNSDVFKVNGSLFHASTNIRIASHHRYPRHRRHRQSHDNLEPWVWPVWLHMINHQKWGPNLACLKHTQGHGNQLQYKVSQ